jgi:hypothetical protein
MEFKIKKIVSGGQTGADRGGLDAAIAVGLPHGGWCPQGRLAEDGKIPEIYHQDELYSRFYAHRTEQNVIDSDATVVFTYGSPEGGSRRTVEFAVKHDKPYLWVDMNNENSVAAAEVIEWLKKMRNSQIILNVAGSRESSNNGLQERVCAVVKSVLLSQDSTF